MAGPQERLLEDRDALFTRTEAARYLSVSIPTLDRWEHLGIGPKRSKIGPRRVAYSMRSLREFVEGKTNAA